VKKTLAVAFALGLLVFTGSALGLSGAASFSDVPGDDNAAPDITSVAIVASSASSVTLKIVAPNYPVLEQGTWFNLYFDIDANPQTGILGGERLVRYVNEIGQNTGVVTASTQLFTAVGNNWATVAPSGIASAYNAGELTLTIPRTALGGADPLGVHVISGRRQPMGAAVFISSDFAPNQGCCISWAGTATASSADPTADHEAAPDITSVNVTDTPSGWIRFEITTPNYAKLRGEDTLVFIHFDTDFRRGTGQVGADYTLGHVDGGAYLDRWSNKDHRWINVPGRVLVRTKNANNVVTLEVHRSALGDVRRFQFRATSAVLHFGTGLTFGVDQAPDIRTTYWGYKFANKTVVRLVAGKPLARPAAPRAGARFTVRIPMKRSDTNRAIAEGTVACNVKVAGKRVRATGSVRSGRAECALVVPQKGKTVSGSLTVRSAKVSATSRFSFRIRR
jgi:hypothetical protein